MSATGPHVPVEAALSILSHVSFAPVLGRLIRARVPDLLESGAVQGAELAKQTGLHPLSTVRAMRALTAFGVFREIAPSTFVNTDLSRMFRDAPGCIRNYALFATFLMRCRERMQSRDRLLVVEMVPVPGQPDVGIALLDMAMMVFGGEARQRIEDEYRALFDATGFNLTRVLATGSAFSILESSPR